jgi:predicted transcriptional regulator
MEKLKREAKAMSKLTVRLSDDLAERLKIRAVKERRTLKAIVTEAIERYLKTSLVS